MAMAVLKLLALLCLLALSTGVLGGYFALLGFSPTCELPRISMAPGTKTVKAQPGTSLCLWWRNFVWSNVCPLCCPVHWAACWVREEPCANLV